VAKIMDGIHYNVNSIKIELDLDGLHMPLSRQDEALPQDFSLKPPLCIIQMDHCEFFQTNANFQTVGLKEAREQSRSNASERLIFNQGFCQRMRMDLFGDSSSDKPFTVFRRQPVTIRTITKKVPVNVVYEKFQSPRL
jgi:hypothetical protein